MKYKSLFRVLVKVIGVWMVATGAVTVVGETSRLLFALVSDVAGSRHGTWLYDVGIGEWLLYSVLPSVIQIIIGLLLFFRPNWIANLAIPSNRPYCLECGYDLTGHAADHCPECGTVKPKGDLL